MRIFSKWQPERVTDAVAAEIADNMAIAAKVVEADARRNLLRISDPEWGAAYRRMLALYRLTSIVEQTPSFIEGGVGIRPGRKGRDYGYWIEVGTRATAAHPWLRPALLHNLSNIIQLLRGE